MSPGGCVLARQIAREEQQRRALDTRGHINMLGRYSFQLPELPELPGGMRPLRDPDAAEDV
ncbi:hypothetical protein [Streptomyces collinus]|uniref:hypothetical protein n=1 Tax=Streptomyces collinus TaxID=42684 RepID=UPI00362CB9A7